MRKNRTRAVLTVGVLSALTLAGGLARAAGPDTNNMATKRVDLNFGRSNTFTHDLVASAALFDPVIADGAALASGIVSAADGTNKLAIRFAQGASGQSVTSNLQAVLQGRAAPGNALKIKFDTPKGVMCSYYDASPQSWCISDEVRQTMPYNLFTDGAQTVPVDTYTASMEGAVWNA